MTPRQQKLWDYIKAYDGKALPTIQRIALDIDQPWSTVQSALYSLERQGKIRLWRSHNAIRCSECGRGRPALIMEVVEE